MRYEDIELNERSKKEIILELLEWINYYPDIRSYLEEVSSENQYNSIFLYCADDYDSTFDELWVREDFRKKLLEIIYDLNNIK